MDTGKNTEPKYAIRLDSSASLSVDENESDIYPMFTTATAEKRRINHGCLFYD